MNPGISFMLGAALGGSSSAVAIPLVKQISIGEKSRTILILESAFSAILCIVVALAIFESYKYGEFRIGIIFGQVFSSFLLASLIGLLGSIFWSMVLDKVRTINNSIFTTPSFVFIVYGINELLGYSGIISALAFGIGLANMDLIHNRWLKKFSDKRPTLLNPTEKTLFSELVFLMKTFFFVYVGISIKFDSLISLLIGLGISVILIILRIPIVRISLPSDINNINNKDRAFLSMMIPRGLAAAVLATMISQSGLAGSERVGNIVFSVIFFTIIFTSVLVPLLEKSKGFRRFYIKLLYFPSFGKKVLFFDDENNNINDNKINVKTETIAKEEDERVSVCDEDDDIPNILL
jgi:NhaP-type Na+/H+ or K+/H+ antiporter